MRALRTTLTAAAIALLALSCGTESGPTSPREARFSVNPGLLDRSFTVVDISAMNARHTFQPPAPSNFSAPYRILLENAIPPVQGIFQPGTVSSINDVQLIFGGETFPRVVSNPSQNSHGCPIPTQAPPFLCVNSGAVPLPMLTSPEVRFDVSGTTGISFVASVGDVDDTHLVDPGPLPATIFLESATAEVTGVFTKIDVNGELLVRLLVNGVEVDAGFSEANGNTDVVLSAEL